MTVEAEPTKEYFIQGDLENKELLGRYREDQKWVYYLVIGLFGCMVILNFLIPDFHWIKPEPINVKFGFIGLVLTFFGSLFFFRAFFMAGGGNWTDIYWWLCIILMVVSLYFGLPILFG